MGRRVWSGLLIALAACGGKAATGRGGDGGVALAARDAGCPTAAPAAAAAAPCQCPAPTAAGAAAAEAATPKDELTLTPVRFTDLPGWTGDHQAEAVGAFRASCGELAKLPDDAPVGADGFSGKARAWRHACERAARLPAGDAAARKFFETEFQPYAAAGRAGALGKLTSYDVAPLRGSRTRHDRFTIPVLARPADLVSVELSSFIPDARGRRIWGRVDAHGALVAYPTRAEIRQGALAGQGLELIWVDDPVDEVFAEIEGSGKVSMDDGSVVWIEFAGKNGRPYHGPGGVLHSMGELAPGGGTMQGIRAWFAAHPERIDEVIDHDTSKVFFKISSQPGAVGSQGVILTAQRSLAIDRAFVAQSTPIWVDTRAPVAGQRHEQPWQKLVIAQDTGGAILGPVRGDIYWGDDAAAADISGRMGGPGRYWLLLPRGLPIARR